MQLVGMRTRNAGDPGPPELDWVVFAADRILYAFTGGGGRYVHSSRLAAARLAPAGVFVALPDGVYRTPFSSLRALAAQLPPSFQTVNRGLVANLAAVQVLRRHEKPVQLGFLISGTYAVPGGEWLFVAEKRVRGVSRALGMPVRRAAATAEAGPYPTE